MSCFHPLRAFQIGETNSGKKQLKICSLDTNHVEKRNGVWYAFSTDFVSPYAERVVRDSMLVPCGKCAGCRIDKSREWANRCMLELQYHDSAYFVTLTYNDQHVPKSAYGSSDTGEAIPALSLCKKDFQLFMKRLRERCKDDKIRFFGCGEYGGQTFRPHYHVILFGLHLDDLVPFSGTDRGYMYYLSDTIQKAWSVYDPDTQSFDPMGHVLVGNVTWETCAYTARYVMKKLDGPAGQLYTDFNVEKPFSLMSRKPGIARQYYDDHPDVYDYEFINVSTATGGMKFRPPKYFDRLFDVDFPDQSIENKALRQRLADERQKAELSKTGLSLKEYLAVKELNFTERIKKLTRGDPGET